MKTVCKNLNFGKHHVETRYLRFSDFGDKIYSKYLRKKHVHNLFVACIFRFGTNFKKQKDSTKRIQIENLNYYQIITGTITISTISRKHSRQYYSNFKLFH